MDKCFLDSVLCPVAGVSQEGAVHYGGFPPVKLVNCLFIRNFQVH